MPFYILLQLTECNDALTDVDNKFYKVFLFPLYYTIKY